MAVLMYESLIDFFDDYDMNDALKTGKALIIHRVMKRRPCEYESVDERDGHAHVDALGQAAQHTARG